MENLVGSLRYRSMNFWNGKKVFITGHTGFKGSWLSFWLKLLGAEVCGFSLPPDSKPNLFETLKLAKSIRSEFGDIRDAELLRKKLSDFEPEIVLHLAAQSLVRRSYREPVETYSTNVMGTIGVLEAVRNVKSVSAVVAVTTDKVYENLERDYCYSENDRLGGFDPYSSSKACTEIAVASYRNSFFSDGRTLIATARSGNVIGGGDWSEDRLLPDVFRSLIFGEKLLIRNPDSVRPWQHTLEPLSGYLLLAEKLFRGEKEFAESWNFGPSEEDSKTVRWILDEVKRNWDGETSWEFDEGERPHEANLLKLDSSKAREQLGWKPKFSLSDAIGFTISWYRDFKNEADMLATTTKQIESYQTDPLLETVNV